VPIDPFSTAYWDPPVRATNALMDPPRMPLNAMKPTSANVNGPNTLTKMFGKPDIAKVAPQDTKAIKVAAKPVSAEDMPAFKQIIQGSELSKVGLIEVLKTQFKKTPKASIKFSLENVAKMVRSTDGEKRWVLNDISMT
jgi:chromatin assembly factor 1 subunit A